MFRHNVGGVDRVLRLTLEECFFSLDYCCLPAESGRE